ncbi:two-component sensor histidine kinase, partial [Nonomuraea mesophila]
MALGAGLAFVIGLVLIAGGAHYQRGMPDWWMAGPLALTCAGVLVRKRAPLLSLGLGVVG